MGKIEQAVQDLRYAWRNLRKSPGFTVAAIATLALGIGANSAMFSIVQGVVLAPLPFREPDRLVLVMESNPRFQQVWISYPNFRDWQRNARSFERMAACRWQSRDLASPGEPEHLQGAQISSGFFETLGLRLARGREFSPAEDQHGGAPVVIISDRLWSSRFGRAAGAIGNRVTLDGADYTIVGVTPQTFQFLNNADVYTPMGQVDPLVINNRGSHDAMLSVARLKAGVSLAQAQAEMSAIQNVLDREYPDQDRDLGSHVAPLKEEIVGDRAETLFLLLGAVLLVLLVASANYANLLLARATARVREIAIRSALGASRQRLIRQLLTESVVLSVVGGGVGVLIATFALHPLLRAVPASLPRRENIHVNAPVLVFSFFISVAVGILFGLMPALKSAKTDAQGSLRERGGAAGGRAQSMLVVGQMALTLMLLAGCGLLLRTIQHLWEANPGFDTTRVITFKVGVSHELMKTAASTRAAYQDLLERIRNVPGVEAADFTWLVPLSGGNAGMPFWIGSKKPASLQAAPRLLMFLTGPDYLRTMRIPLLRGRFFTLEDTTKSPCVVVIDSDFVQQYFPDSDPIGQTLSMGFATVGPCEIVGVVGHVRHSGMGELGTYTKAQAYGSLYQDPDQWVPINYPNTTVVVRTALSPAMVMPGIRAAVSAVGGEQPVYDVETMQQMVWESMSAQRFPMILLGAFAGLALVLACVGMYGVVSYSVTRRVQEIGIRMAIGAEKRTVLWMVIGEGLRLAFIGSAIGAAASVILARVLASFSHLLYGVQAWDPVTFASFTLLLIGTAFLACYVPARQASKLEPMMALRHE